MDINLVEKKSISEIEDSKNIKDLSAIEIKYLGRKGELTELLKSISTLPVSERKIFGAETNRIKKKIEELIKTKRETILNSSISKSIDITAPGEKYPEGHLHPITHFLNKSINVFKSMGFEVYESPEIDLAYYNFDAINVPKDHPARDAWDTFYIKDGLDLSDDKKMLLRTHTSNSQVRAMEDRKPPVRIVVPGRCYRNENVDASHETTFYQMEGFVIDKGVALTDLMGTVRMFAQKMFGPEVKIRPRPHYYPFTEPSIDFDISCILCGGKGCPVCKNSGWLEVMPSGMINPKVIKNMGLDPEVYSGFAFGFGIDRLMMLYHGINDIRLSYSGDLRFLEQF